MHTWKSQQDNTGWSEGKVKDELKEQVEKYLVVSSDLGSL